MLGRLSFDGNLNQFRYRNAVHPLSPDRNSRIGSEDELIPSQNARQRESHSASTPSANETAAQEMFKHAVDMMPDATCWIDAKGFIIHGNEEFDKTILTAMEFEPRGNILKAMGSDRQRFYSALQVTISHPGYHKETVRRCLITVRLNNDREMDVFYDWVLSSDDSKKKILAIGRWVTPLLSPL